ncbi:AP2/ERF domain-containing protein [Dioscorea alata]|uniref:AP2/ERF domain-containing protein n=1 Tax=Dioscorea alata TaxID=55571 RepID=A0ACB7UYB3_DIOAL|nr:AP2/ERF domain-containing protein [Dioscorea alata]
MDTTDLQCIRLPDHQRRRYRGSTGYLGVRSRPSGRYAAEIKNPHTRKRHYGIDRAQTNFSYMFPTMPSSPPSLPPPPPPPLPPPPPPPIPHSVPPPSEEKKEYDFEYDFEINNHDDDCINITTILQSFSQSNAFSSSFIL